MSEYKFVNITGLWKNIGKNGKEYLSGNLGGAKIFIFENENKKTPQSPSHRLVIAPSRRAGEKKERMIFEDTPRSADFEDDDIPF